MEYLRLLAIIVISISMIFIILEFILFLVNSYDFRYVFLMFFKFVVVFWFFVLFLFACSSQKTVIRDKRLTTPPDRYEIGVITNSQQALLEYGNALFTIARWQNWYNLNVGSNYYNYYNYSNELYIRRTNDNIEISETISEELNTNEKRD